MSEPQENKDTPQAPPQRIEHEVPLDMRLLSEAVIELNISRKNVGIYPPGHIQIANSIERAYRILQKLFEIRKEMTLGVAKDTLLIGKDYLDQRNPVYRDFALSMSQQGIASVTFVSGLEKDELVRFHGILTTRPDDIRASGGIDKVMAGTVIPHIRIQSIDYSSFHVTEEQEIFKAPARAGGEESGGHLWQDFVTHLSAGTLAGPGQGMSVKDAEQIDPAELARLLNERKLDANAAVESYDHIISNYVRGTAEKKQISQEQSKTLANMNALLKDLHPELRKQFLSVAFKNIAPRTASRADAEAVIGGFTDDIVIEMLGQASAEGREISPTLAGLVGKLAQTHTDGSTTGARHGMSKQPVEGSPGIALQAEHMQKLFDREKYEEYVTDDYQTMLRQLSENSPTAVEPFMLADQLQTLEDEHLDFQIGRALLAFLEENIDEEDYKEFAQKIVAIMPQFLETGNFEMLWDILETLRRHSTDKPEQGIREIAAESRKFFFNPEFIAKALSAFDRWMREKGQAASGLIQALGPETIPGLIDIFCDDETVGGRRMLFNLLCLFGEPAVREAQKRLRDPRPKTVRNLLIFIGRAGSVASVPEVKPLLQHQDPKVRLEALGVLLKFKDPEAIGLLRTAIHDKDPDFASQAVALAGHYRSSDVTADVLSKIKRIILFETDYAENEEIIKVLGAIGDARAIPDLEKLASATWSLYPASLMHMKETIYASLSRYPREQIAGLLRIGEKLNSDTIRRTCSQLMDKQ